MDGIFQIMLRYCYYIRNKKYKSKIRYITWSLFWNKNEFNRYKKKSESGQVFTPEHITSLMYRLIDVHQYDRILDVACGSVGFLVKSMSKMIKESGGIQTDKEKNKKSTIIRNWIWRKKKWYDFLREKY